jgi:hypothetical protein
MSSSSRKNNTKNTANSESVNNKNHLRRTFEKQKRIIRTLEDKIDEMNKTVKELYDDILKNSKNYSKLAALKDQYDRYGLYTGDLTKTITLCQKEHRNLDEKLTNLWKVRENLYNATVLYIQDIEYTTLVKNSNVNNVKALLMTLHKNYTKLKNQQKLQNTTIQKQNNTNLPINTIQNSLEFSNRNNNSRR